MAETKRQALIVLGMHRSGTSALSGMLAKLGAREPSTPMPPTIDNPRGYWESVEFMRFHDAILSSSGSSWDDWGRFNPGWLESAAASDFTGQLPQVLEQEFGDAGLLLLKDPRICRFFPFWLQGLAQLGIAPKVVFALRHPVEVAESLRARDGFGRNRALLLWLRHVLDAEHASRPVARCFVHYRDLLEDWRSQAQRIARELGIQWPKWSSSVELEIDGHLATELRRHVAEPGAVGGGPELSQWVRDAMQALERIAAGEDEAKPRAALDRIRAEFDRTAGIYGVVVREQIAQAEAEKAGINEALAGSTQRGAELAARLEASEQALSAGQARESANALKLEGLAGRIAELDAALATEGARLAEAREGAAALARQLEARDGTVVQLQGELAERNQAFEGKAVELAELQGRLAERDQAFEKKAVEFTELKGRLAERDRALEKKAVELTELQGGLAERNQALADKSSELGQWRQRLEEQAGLLSEARAQVQQLQAQALQKDASIVKLELQVLALKGDAGRHARQEDARFRELAKLTERLLALESEARTAGVEHERMGTRLDNSLAEVARLQAKLEAIERSGAWRLTAPLRAAARVARGTKQEDPARLLRASGMFDEAWYLETYPDVRESGIDPVEHYLRHGAAENRNPGPGFSTAAYRARHPELDAAGTNPLLHAIRCADDGAGAKPGRSGERG